MTLRTTFTDLMRVEHPVALAPMGGSAGGALAAAVSNGGGLGLIGGGRESIDWLEREVSILGGETDKPWGVGFLTWAASVATVERSLELGPIAVMLSFGDPALFAELVRMSGAKLIIQVVDLDEARRAVDVGADVIVAQGTESGGHGGSRPRATLPFVPAVVDLVSPIPVLAAGGIADGRGLAAALSLGAAGALVGTRFQASTEALVDPKIVDAILEGSGGDTERSRVLDIARGAPWPARYPGTSLRNEFLDHWRDRENELEADPEAKKTFREAVASGDMHAVPVWAGEAIDLITESRSAADIVQTMATSAETALRRVLDGR
jgi:nitronate monooxygenase